MISPYYGEFLVSPIPMDLALNYCSHKCAYCFANLNTPGRKANVQSILNLISEREERTTLAAELLKRKYPVLIANKVDGFAASNYKIALPIMKLLRSLDIPLAFQTKGGKGIDEALKFLNPSAWYVSIATLNEDVRKSVEPGAPSIADRLKLCEKLLSAGHHVSIGMNPIVKEWLPDPSALLRQLKSIGVNHVWIETLHLNNNQTREMSERERAAITEPIISRAMRREADAETYNYFVDALESAMGLGMEVYCMNCPYPTKYWEPYFALYPKRFPVFSEFLNAKKQGDELRFDECWDVLRVNLPLDIRKNISDYIGATSPYIKNTHSIPKDAGFKTLLSIIWSDYRAKSFPLKNWALDVCKDKIDGKDFHVDDLNGIPVYIHTGKTLQRKAVN